MVDLLDLGFELLALALQFGNLLLGRLVPLFLDRARELLPVIFDMIPIHAILRFLLISELSVNKSVQMALGALDVAGAMEDRGCHATLSRESLAGLSASTIFELRGEWLVRIQVPQPCTFLI
jgi:hypothetical protein